MSSIHVLPSFTYRASFINNLSKTVRRDPSLDAPFVHAFVSDVIHLALGMRNATHAKCPCPPSIPENASSVSNARLRVMRRYRWRWMLPSCTRAPPTWRSLALMLSAIAPIFCSLALTLARPRAAHHRRRLGSILSAPFTLFWTTAASDDAD